MLEFKTNHAEKLIQFTAIAHTLIIDTRFIHLKIRFFS